MKCFKIYFDILQAKSVSGKTVMCVHCTLYKRIYESVQALIREPKRESKIKFKKDLSNNQKGKN